MPEVRAIHVPALRVRIKPPGPTATQSAMVGQLMPSTGSVVPVFSLTQVVPSVVDIAMPSLPTVTQWVTLAQLMLIKLRSEPVIGFDCAGHVEPPSAVLLIAPGQPTV